VAAAAVWFGAAEVEASLEDQTIQLLRANGYNDIEVNADGRELHLVGTVGDNVAVEAIPRAVSQLDGVRAVDGDLRVVEASDEGGPVAADPLAIDWAEGEVEIVGTVSGGEVRSTIISAAEVLFPGNVDAGDLVIRPGVRSEGAWLENVVGVFLDLGAAVDAGRIVVNPDESVVTVAAEFPDRQARGEIERTAEESLTASGLDFVNGLTVEDAPPPPPREEVVELQEDLDDLIAGKVVEFEVNSDLLTVAGQALLDEILAALRQFPDVPIEIAGHADASGSPDFNLDLSQRRADAVLEYLAERGEDRSRFVVIGYGETQPVADNDTAEGRARNRRIEFIALDQ
jgi:OOP family OmpA-OmpF porin